MNSFTKKWLALALILVVSAVSVFAGGGNQGSTSGGGTGKLSAIALTHQLTKDLNTMQWLKDVQKKANVTIEWQQISADWGDKKAALFASGDIPDILLGGTTSTSDYSVYNGLFEDLAPLIEAHAPNIKKMFTEHPELKALVTQMDGKIYGLPQYKRFGAMVVSPMYINKQWLDKVGKKVPTTWAELKDVLLAFRDQDANGNGDKNDEIPMDFRPFGELFTPQYLLGSLGLPISDYADGGYFAENGKVKNYYVDDRFKTLMIFLADLYSQGLIGSEVVTQDYGQWQSTSRNDGKYTKVGVTFGWTPGDRMGDQFAPQYISLPPLKYSAGSTNTVYYAYDNEAQNYGTDKFSLSSRCKDKVAAIRFIDQFYDPIISMQVCWGGMNTVDNCITDRGDGSYIITPPSDSKMNAGIWKWTNSFVDNGAFYIADYLKLTPDTDVLAVTDTRKPYEDQLKLYNNKTNIYPSGFMKYSTADNQTLAMNDANIGNLTKQWALWMTGQGNIEAEWNAYVKSVNDAGLQQNLQIRQKAFDAYVKQL